MTRIGDGGIALLCGEVLLAEKVRSARSIAKAVRSNELPRGRPGQSVKAMQEPLHPAWALKMES